MARPVALFRSSLIALDRLSQPPAVVGAEESTAKVEEGFVADSAALVADGQLVELAQSRQRTFHHPAAPARPLGTVYSPADDGHLQ
jgi:hypothetical protein